MKKVIIYLLVSLFLIFPINVNAKNKDINLYLFYSKTCIHCHDEIEYLNQYLIDKDNIKLHKYEVTTNKDNINIFNKIQKVLDKKAKGVPYLVIGNQVISGYNELSTPQNIESTINYYLDNDYKDIIGEELGIIEKSNTKIGNKELEKTYNIPLIGDFKAKNVSLLLLSVIMGTVDGFNPCAMWILVFLISMLFNMKDKKRMWILGISFLLASAITYLLFMLSILNITMFLNEVNIIKIIIGIVAITFGTFNIKKYINSRKVAGCEVVNKTKRKKIISKIQNIITEKKLILSLLGIITLAVGVNIIELVCSLGLPVMFTEVLSLNNLSPLNYGIYIFIYIIFFLIDDLIVFIIAMKTLKIKSISNKYTKYSHLIGGIIMLLIGILIIFKPEWLSFTF